MQIVQQNQKVVFFLSLTECNLLLHVGAQKLIIDFYLQRLPQDSRYPSLAKPPADCTGHQAHFHPTRSRLHTLL